MSDWISLVEASYDLRLDQQAWLDQVADKVALLIRDEGTGVTAHVFHLSATQYRQEAWAGGGAQWQDWLMRALIKLAPPRAVDIILRSGDSVGTLNDLVSPTLPIAKRLCSQLTLGKLRDAFGVAAHTGTGMGVALSKGMTSPRVYVCGTRSVECCSIRSR